MNSLMSREKDESKKSGVSFKLTRHLTLKFLLYTRVTSARGISHSVGSPLSDSHHERYAMFIMTLVYQTIPLSDRVCKSGCRFTTCDERWYSLVRSYNFAVDGFIQHMVHRFFTEKRWSVEKFDRA